jgi:hypothetical protein
MNNNLMLYGSIARGDYTTNSDIDLLSIVSGKTEKIVSHNLNLSKYNIEQISKMAKEGSLFVFHLAKEGKILIDEGNIIYDILHNKFKLKSSYSDEISFSVNVLQMLIEEYDTTLNFSFINAKIAWCIRTIFASIGAENGFPLFAIADIQKTFSRRVSTYIAIKNRDDYCKQLAEEILKFVLKEINVNELGDFSKRNDLLLYKNSILKKIRNHSSIDMY